MSPKKPRTVFLSYSHDDQEHREWVLGLSQRLRQDGFESILDQYLNGGPPESWPRWMLDQLDIAEQVLVICTETYYRRFRGHEVPNQGKGVDWEGLLITQELYEARSESLKFVAVLRSRDADKWIPEPLRGRTSYVLDSERSYLSLLEFLNGTAGVVPGPIVPRPVPPRRTAQPADFDNPRWNKPGPDPSAASPMPEAPRSRPTAEELFEVDTVPDPTPPRGSRVELLRPRGAPAFAIVVALAGAALWMGSKPPVAPKSVPPDLSLLKKARAQDEQCQFDDSWASYMQVIEPSQTSQVGAILAQRPSVEIPSVAQARMTGDCSWDESGKTRACSLTDEPLQLAHAPSSLRCKVQITGWPGLWSTPVPWRDRRQATLAELQALKPWPVLRMNDRWPRTPKHFTLVTCPDGISSACYSVDTLGPIQIGQAECKVADIVIKAGEPFPALTFEQRPYWRACSARGGTKSNHFYYSTVYSGRKAYYGAESWDACERQRKATAEQLIGGTTDEACKPCECGGA